jgi:hypothetical protein
MVVCRVSSASSWVTRLWMRLGLSACLISVKMRSTFMWSLISSRAGSLTSSVRDLRVNRAIGISSA